MPVLLKEPSEYQRNYKWHQSQKSRSYSPPLDAVKPPAGVPSMIAAKTTEPTITTKKKINQPEVTKTTKFDYVPVEDDYILLGNNEKFASNVQYRSKSRDRAMNLLQKSKPQPAENGDNSEPLTPREPPPAPRVKYDPGAPKTRSPVKSKSEPTATSKGVEVRNGGPVAEKSILRHTQKNVNKGRDIEPVKSKSVSSKLKIGSVLQEKKTVNKPRESKPTREQPKDKRDTRKGKMHEYAQTDMEKGVSYSGQEAPADYAMKYQAGIAPPRTRGPKRLSEYAMQFQWKKGIPSSPLLAAEQIVYKSNPQAPPFRNNTMAKPSEYNAQFKPWHLLKSTPNLRQAVEEEIQDSSTKKKARKHKRSKSLEDLSPDARPAAGGLAAVSPEDKRLLKESLNPQRLHFPHGKFKRIKSEYASNFAAPQMFDYDGGAWKGADPPHIVQRPDEQIQRDDNHYISWFREVVELRRKADEYKKRALGTHFSRSHMAQLYAKQAEMWDTVSNDGHESVISALSLESPVSNRSRQSSRASSRQVRKSRKDTWMVAQSADSPSAGTVTPNTERTYTPDIPDDNDDDLVSCNDSEVSSNQNNHAVEKPMGRIPTPKLQVKKTFVTKNRHHLDRTTPAVGGALLTSPPQETPSVDSGPIVHKSKKGLKTWSVPNAHAVRESISAPEQLPVNHQNKSPTFGKPTQDSHVLVDEDAASDHTLKMNFVKTLPEVLKDKKELQSRLSTIKEMSGEYKSTKCSTLQNATLTVDDIPKRPPTEDDEISFSARSIASSCSFASEVLERAKNRRDNFWGD